MTTATKVIQFGPMIGLQWPEGRMWIQRSDLETIRIALVPMAPPPEAGVTGTCWVWTGPVASDGRPMLHTRGDTIAVRRLLYDLEYGPLQARTYLAPMCQVPRCCNPRHCQPEERGPVRMAEGMGGVNLGVDRCRYGHPLTQDNVYLYQGRKLCRTCRAAAEKRHRERDIRAGRARGAGNRTGRAAVGQVVPGSRARTGNRPRRAAR